METYSQQEPLKVSSKDSEIHWGGLTPDSLHFSSGMGVLGGGAPVKLGLLEMMLKILGVLGGQSLP